MELKSRFNSVGQTYVARVKDQEQNQEQVRQNVVLVVAQDSKQYVKAHSWFNKFVEIVMDKELSLDIHVQHVEEKE